MDLLERAKQFCLWLLCSLSMPTNEHLFTHESLGDLLAVDVDRGQALEVVNVRTFRRLEQKGPVIDQELVGNALPIDALKILHRLTGTLS